MKQPKEMHPYLKWGMVAGAAAVALSVGFLAFKGPALVKGMAKASLERSLAPFGIKQVKIDAAQLGWGRVYLQDIRTDSPPSAPSLSIQEMDIALSLFLKVKAIDMVGVTLELKDQGVSTFSQEAWQSKMDHFGKTIDYLKWLKIPTISMHDGLLIFPASQGPLKIPVHVVTEMTVARNQILTVDWGEHGDNAFYGQFILELGKQGAKVDIHAANVDIKLPSFQIKAPEISFWGTVARKKEEGCQVDGFAKLDHLGVASYGYLKMPLEVNCEGAGTEDNFALDALTVSSPGSEANLLEMEGTYKPGQGLGQVTLTSQIPRLSKLWDFTPLLATHASDKVHVDGEINAVGEASWERGSLKSSMMALDIKKAAIARDSFSIEGGAAQVVFSTIVPLKTKGSQRLSATKVSFAGIDLKNALLECLLDKQGFLQIRQFTAEALGGNIKASQFQRLPHTAHPSYKFEADFKNIELADILKLTDLSSLSGRARLAGSATMRYGLGDGLDVAQAELHSISDSGVIQYKPDETSGETSPLDQQEVNMAFQVLNDLNFTIFNVRLEHAPNNPSEMQGFVKILGSNPKVLNGYPFEFNIVTTGKLKDLVINTIQRIKPPMDLNEIHKVAQATQQDKAQQDKAVKVDKIKRIEKKGKMAKRFKKKNGRPKNV